MIHLINKQQPIHFDVKDFNFIIYERVEELKKRLRERIQSTVRSSPRDVLSAIQQAVNRYLEFEKRLQKRMVKDRVTEFTLQDYDDEDQLPAPFSGPIMFHVKGGLSQKWGDRLRFDMSDSSVYGMRPWGSYGQYKRGRWLGLVRSAADLDELMRRLEATYEHARSAAK